MILRVLTAIAFVGLFQIGYAQEHIQLEETFFNMPMQSGSGVALGNPMARHRFRLDGGDLEFKNVGFGGRNLRPYLLHDPEALKYLNNYRRNRSIAFSSSLLAVTGFSLWLLGGSSDVDDPQNSDVNNWGDEKFMYAGIGFFVSNCIFSILSNNDIRKAVRTYNKHQRESYGHAVFEPVFRITSQQANAKVYASIGLRIKL
ncbi:MAG TPA: hypothetical protein VGK59_10335 [Ohtaekwangia sp.]